jgi:hypothetical protein
MFLISKTTLRKLLCVFTAPLLVLVTTTASAKEKPPVVSSSKPNILFIFADDQSYETVHAHGN